MKDFFTRLFGVDHEAVIRVIIHQCIYRAISDIPASYPLGVLFDDFYRTAIFC